MAKKQLTIEEKLQAALVPAEEQPYKVPDNWCWWKLKSFSEIRTGKKDANYGTENGKYLFFTCASAPIRCDGYSFEGKSILLAGNGDIGNISLYEGKFEAYQRTYVLDIEKSLSTEYVYYYFKYKWVDYNNDKMYGSAIPYIRLGNLKEFPLPVPPVKEQNHIVSIIESFFAKLDEAKEKIQEVLDGADLRRAAILHQAFTGKLTEKWRRENGVSDDSRETSNVKSICNSLKYGTAKKSVQDGDVAVLRMGNLQNGEIDWGSLVYSNDQDDIEKYSLKDGDVLFNRTNSAELVGKTSIYRGERPAIYAGYLIKLDYKRDKIIGDFFNYMLNSPKAKEYCNKVKTDGVNQSNINAKKIGAFEFDVPTILEQQEIVRLLDNLLSREQSTVTACEEALTIIDTLKKSILARAFRGELGTGDPSEASAKELLQEILAS